MRFQPFRHVDIRDYTANNAEHQQDVDNGEHGPAHPSVAQIRENGGQLRKGVLRQGHHQQRNERFAYRETREPAPKFLPELFKSIHASISFENSVLAIEKIFARLKKSAKIP